MVRGFKLYFINNQYLKMVATVILSMYKVMTSHWQTIMKLKLMELNDDDKPLPNYIMKFNDETW